MKEKEEVIETASRRAIRANVPGSERKEEEKAEEEKKKKTRKKKKKKKRQRKGKRKS